MSGKTDPKVMVIIPAYNEATVIGSVLDKLLADLKKSRLNNVQVVVVNDGSKDNTAGEVKQRKDVTLVSHILNSGAGAAIRTGLGYARDKKADYAVAMDADGQHDSKDMIRVLKELMTNSSDIVIGSRLINAEGMPWYRVMLNKGGGLFTFLLFGIFVKDSQSGLRGFNRKALEKISFHSNNYTYNSELMWRIKQNRLRVKEIPIKAIYSEYSLSKGQSNWEVIHIVRELLKYRFLEFFNG
ncbi:glycosyltransferase family 2 protein [Candidatus Saccharibacteria bacterium]|nr:glycosyltransferase family 2 protein [Candidatus Saccharibacteria bacterium]